MPPQSCPRAPPERVAVATEVRWAEKLILHENRGKDWQDRGGTGYAFGINMNDLDSSHDTSPNVL